VRDAPGKVAATATSEVPAASAGGAVASVAHATASAGSFLHPDVGEQSRNPLPSAAITDENK